MPRRYPLFQAKPEVLGEPLQFLHAPLHLLHQILELRPQIVVQAVTEYRRQSNASPSSLVVRESYAFQETDLLAELLRARVQEMRLQVTRGAEILNPQLPQIIERRAETELDVGEQNVGAPEDQAAGLFG